MDNAKYDGWVVGMRGEFGNYDDSDWARVEVEGKVVDVMELRDTLQRFVESIGFNYLDVELVNKGVSDE